METIHTFPLMAAGDLSTALAMVLPCIAKPDKRWGGNHYTHTLCLEHHAAEVALIGTDGYLLAAYVFEAEEGEGERIRCLLPHEKLAGILALLKTLPTDFQVPLQCDGVALLSGGVRFDLADVKFPDWRTVLLPSEPADYAEFPADSMANLLKAMKMRGEKNPVVEITRQGDSLQVRAVRDAQSWSAIVPAVFTGWPEGTPFCIDPNYMADACSVFGSNSMRMALSEIGQKNRAEFTCQAWPSYVQIVMLIPCD